MAIPNFSESPTSSSSRIETPATTMSIDDLSYMVPSSEKQNGNNKCFDGNKITDFRSMELDNNKEMINQLLEEQEEFHVQIGIDSEDDEEGNKK